MGVSIFQLWFAVEPSPTHVEVEITRLDSKDPMAFLTCPKSLLHLLEITDHADRSIWYSSRLYIDMSELSCYREVEVRLQ